jgi:hypothetical protein
VLQFFVDTEVELQHPRPNGFPASGIWGYRIANVALNLLNYFWCVRLWGKPYTLRATVQQGTGLEGCQQSQHSHM